MLCEFQVYSRVIQLYIFIYLFFFRFFSHIGDYRVKSPGFQCWQLSTISVRTECVPQGWTKSPMRDPSLVLRTRDKSARPHLPWCLQPSSWWEGFPWLCEFWFHWFPPAQAFSFVCLCSGCPDKIPHTLWLKQQKCIISEFWRLEAHEAFLLSLQMAIFLLPLHVVISLCRGLWCPSVCPHCLLRRTPVSALGPTWMASFLT